jgi:O-antigen/teichoic acid export membrane protein
MAKLGRELRPMAALTFSEGAGRFLSFVFYVLAARVLTTSGFGVLRYTIALALLAFGGLQVLVTALTRELGATRGDDRATSVALGSGLAAAPPLLGASCALCTVAALLGLTGSADLLGIVVVLAGLTVFQLYYAIGRGLGDSPRAVVTYAGGSAAQLVLLVAIAAVGDPDARAALIVFGLSAAVPVIAYELWSPAIRGRALSVERSELRRLWQIAVPLVLAQVAFVVWIAADQVWVETVLGTREVGVYGAAKNLAQIFFVIPAGVTGVLLPRVAELRSQGDVARARRLISRTTAGLLVVSAMLAVAVLAARTPLLGGLYGTAYEQAAPSMVGLSVGMVVYAGFVGVTTAAIGWGRPGVFTLGIVAAAAGEVAYLLLVGGHEATTAAWATAASITLGFVVVLARLRARPLGVAG